MVKTEGIVFRSFKYRETSLIVDIFTLDLGLRSYLINGVRSSKSKNAASLLQPMTFLDLIVYDKNGSQKLNRIKEYKLSIYFLQIPFDVIRSMIGQCMVEILRKCVKDHDENESLYNFIRSWFVFLDRSTENLNNLLIMFLIELATIMGFGLSYEKEEHHEIFDMQEGQFVRDIPDHKYYITGPACVTLFDMIQATKGTCHEVEMSNPVRSILIDELLVFFRLHVESFGELKSLEILRTIVR